MNKATKKRKIAQWKETIPYQVMRKFASGEIQELNDQGLSAPQIVKSLFPDTKSDDYRPYITDSLGSTYTGSKSIFSLKSSYRNCLMVADEFKKEGKELSSDFIAKMNKIKPE